MRNMRNKYNIQLQSSLLTLKMMMEQLDRLEPLSDDLIEEGMEQMILLTKCMELSRGDDEDIQLAESLFNELYDLMALSDEIKDKKDNLWDRYVHESRASNPLTWIRPVPQN